MPNCIIFGDAGYIGTKLAEHFINSGRFNTIHIADITLSPLAALSGVTYHAVDVRQKITIDVSDIQWIFNFAAIHREPGHQSEEYYTTNILGANHVNDFADKVGCQNIFFTSSIAVYGPTLRPTDETTLTMPNTPYGISKLTAEYIHRVWSEKDPNRRLIIVRPGVIYGPGDPGNILRMITAIKNGYFFLPVHPSIKKSYGYIYGLIDSIEFAMAQPDKTFCYNYVEKETQPLGDLVAIVNKTLGFNGRLIRIPHSLLKTAASIIHQINPNINGIHPERVKKLARPTHIVPKVLGERNFNFRYSFENSLTHWKSKSPSDF